jgi:hypothetical protein
MKQETKKFSSYFVIPGLLGLMSLAIMLYGFFEESPFIGIGFVLFVTSIVVGVFWYGAATSVMETSIVPVAQPKVRKAA